MLDWLIDHPCLYGGRHRAYQKKMKKKLVPWLSDNMHDTTHFKKAAAAVQECAFHVCHGHWSMKIAPSKAYTTEPLGAVRCRIGYISYITRG